MLSDMQYHSAELSCYLPIFLQFFSPHLPVRIELPILVSYMAFQIKILSPLALPLQLAVDMSLSSGQWDANRSNIRDFQVMHLKA